MADNSKKQQGKSSSSVAGTGGTKTQQPSRLQRRAPASIQINRSTDWNAAIPLLSPLVTSPTSPTFNLKAEINSVASSSEKQAAAASTTTSFEKWQHPAAPFCYEPPPLVPFVCSTGFGPFGGVDRL